MEEQKPKRKFKIVTVDLSNEQSLLAFQAQKESNNGDLSADIEFVKGKYFNAKKVETKDPNLN